jgi:hypothetical protein
VVPLEGNVNDERDARSDWVGPCLDALTFAPWHGLRHLQEHGFGSYVSQPMRSSSYVMRTASRRYRGHRIMAIQLGSTWHASVHGHTGPILKIIESTSLADAMAQAEWFIEARLKFRPRSRGERKAGVGW